MKKLFTLLLTFSLCLSLNAQISKKGITGSGTTGTVPIFTGSNKIGNSSLKIFDSGNVTTYKLSNYLTSTLYTDSNGSYSAFITRDTSQNYEVGWYGKKPQFCFVDEPSGKAIILYLDYENTGESVLSCDNPIIFKYNNGSSLKLGTNIILDINSIPYSDVGLPSGALYTDGEYLKIVP